MLVGCVGGGREGGLLQDGLPHELVEVLLPVVFEFEGEAEGLVGELDELPRDELVVVVVL
jgi:hypothetical protein